MEDYHREEIRCEAGQADYCVSVYTVWEAEEYGYLIGDIIIYQVEASLLSANSVLII